MTEKCFVDTNIFVYARDRSDPEKQQKSVNLITQLKSSNQLVISTQVITEFSSVMTKKFNAPFENLKKDIDRLIELEPEPLDSETIVLGFNLFQQYRLSLWDCWIIASALKANCKKIYSEDLSHGASYHGLVVNNPFIL